VAGGTCAPPAWERRSQESAPRPCPGPPAEQQLGAELGPAESLAELGLGAELGGGESLAELGLGAELGWAESWPQQRLGGRE